MSSNRPLRNVTQVFVAFRYSDFRLLWISESISAIGTGMFYVAVNYQVFQMTNSAFALGGVGVARLLPVLAFGLVGGLFADAHNRKRILAITQPLIALCSFALAVATFTHRVTPAAIYVATALVAGAVAFDLPARSALIPTLVERRDLVNAFGVYEILWQTAGVVGPALGGILLAQLGTGGVYALDGLSTLAVIAALYHMEATGEPQTVVGLSPVRSIREGLLFLAAQPVLRATLLLDFLVKVLAPATALLPVFAVVVLRVGPEQLGLLYAAPALGAIIGSLLFTARARRVLRRGAALLLAVTLYGLATVAFGLSRQYLVSLVALALAGAAGSVGVVLRQTIQQTITPDAFRGRVGSVYMLSFMGGARLGDLQAGVVTSAIGGPFAVIIGGVAALTVVGLFAAFTPSLRRHEPEE